MTTSRHSPDVVHGVSRFMVHVRVARPVSPLSQFIWTVQSHVTCVWFVAHPVGSNRLAVETSM